MKYVVVLYDGMADYPVPALDGKTPMQVAKKPNMDYLAKHGEVGLIRTVAEGLKPGSDVANMRALTQRSSTPAEVRLRLFQWALI